MLVASTNSTSPPAPVTARPVATPGVAVRAADSWKNFWRPSASRTASTSMFSGAFAGATSADLPSAALLAAALAVVGLASVALAAFAPLAFLAVAG